MKKWLLVCLIVLTCSISYGESIIQDNFNSYTNGSIVGQGGWQSYDTLGYNFIVQDVLVFEGAKALYCNTTADNVVGKQGSLLMDGKQTFYVRTENRGGWNPVTTDDGNAQLRITKGLWGAGIAMTFTRDGYVTYLDPVLHSYEKFAPYNDNEWTKVEAEWRSIDITARYCVNSGVWTDWKPLWHIDSFQGLDYVNFAFDFRSGGSGGVYFDNAVPEPSTWILFIAALITGTFFLHRKLRK